MVHSVKVGYLVGSHFAALSNDINCNLLTVYPAISDT